ncbi:hypothetical protein DPX16_23819 [Anabarilius grahami]|uniref:Uncharacterized protein n=1 Tax=Anabarilius grahami TaxID=495550 RepID=A0A3N0Z4U9_ANAGA|nr:hypothetical protein DPX16_23819 [Anabarilius grahami]
MGLFLLPISPAVPKTTILAVDRLGHLRKNACPLERYVEEFSDLSCLVGWPDASLNVCFLMGLDEDTIRYIEPACYFSLVESVNLILYLNGSNFEVEEVKEKKYPPCPAPSETHVAWSAHLPPVPSTYPSSDSVHSCPRWPPSQSLDLRWPLPPQSLHAKMAAATSDPRGKMAMTILQRDSKVVAATREPCRKKASATTEPHRKMAAAMPEPSLKMAATTQELSPVSEEDHWTLIVALQVFYVAIPFYSSVLPLSPCDTAYVSSPTVAMCTSSYRQPSTIHYPLPCFTVHLLFVNKPPSVCITVVSYPSVHKRYTRQRCQPVDMGKTLETGGEEGLYSAPF